VVIDDYLHGVRVLRDRREQLCLAQDEVEDCAGLTTGHIAKAEKVPPDRVMGLDHMKMWAEALGYDIVFRQKDLPMVTLGVMGRSRDTVVSRRRLFQQRRKASGR